MSAQGGAATSINGTNLIIPDYMPSLFPGTVGIAPFIRPSNVIMPSLSNGFLKARQYFNPNDDPELHKSVIKHFFNKLREVWLTSSMMKLLRYIKIEGGNPMVVRTYQEFENNNDFSNQAKKIDYILDRIFSKYDLEVLLEKVAAEYMLNWYDMKNTHNDLIKKEIYRKIKHRLSRLL